jgi:hypothetical protein
LAERQDEQPVESSLVSLSRPFFIGLATAQLAGKTVAGRMLNGTEGIELGDQPCDRTPGRTLVPLTQWPPDPREEVESTDGFIKSLSCMGPQQRELAWL